MICSQPRLRTRFDDRKSIAQNFSRFRRAPLVAKTGVLILPYHAGIRRQFSADERIRRLPQRAADRRRRRDCIMPARACDALDLLWRRRSQSNTAAARRARTNLHAADLVPVDQPVGS